MPRVKVLYFARAREAAGVSEEAVELEAAASTTKNLLEKLVAAHPQLQSVLDCITLAINEEYAEGDDVELKAGDEVALIPPISGG
mmetsp:Transcript_9535/g.31372  ORF Transcript_9535/g.31372 Transcript_9535/m.31372 type:complete len:85 (+) Transcript_9535:111-365(+)